MRRLATATILLTAVTFSLSCRNESVAAGGPGREYEVVAEGQAEGVPGTIGGAGTALTDTSADTTTSFTVVPSGTDATAMAPLPPMIGTPGGTYSTPGYPGGYGTAAPRPSTPSRGTIEISRSPRPATSTTAATATNPPNEPLQPTTTADPEETEQPEPEPEETPEADPTSTAPTTSTSPEA